MENNTDSGLTPLPVDDDPRMVTAKFGNPSLNPYELGLMSDINQTHLLKLLL